MTDGIWVITRMIENRDGLWYSGGVACFQPDEAAARRLVDALDEESRAFFAWLKIEFAEGRHEYEYRDAVLDWPRGQARLRALVDGAAIHDAVREHDERAMGVVRIKYHACVLAEEPERWLG